MLARIEDGILHYEISGYYQNIANIFKFFAIIPHQGLIAIQWRTTLLWLRPFGQQASSVGSSGNVLMFASMVRF